ncbi:unnamed protein product [Thlaspi arvense]|uniref:Phorbol-ester/DAG-type domain-containing protein n=1 Tax=Thlaspi arvense TaxID=13288 RepID=A0AAU9SEY3_THLAR|nr:unnamed protein product [Thlaspi arvense]
MGRGDHKVKFSCNHPLDYVELKEAEDNTYTEADPSHNCDGCGEVDGYGYYCDVCEIGAHVQCIDFPETINYPCHSRHPLKKVVSLETIDYTDGTCHFCRDKLGEVMYHCSICNISIDLNCSRKPPPVTIYEPKSHNHAFTIMPIKVSFTCSACGMDGGRNPYVCLECGFMLHKHCIYLPRVIEINRHDHRISRTYQLDRGDWECGVCRKKMDWTFGAFSCQRCSNYAVHSRCATRNDVWDGIELEDEPEEEEIEDPYVVINENEIIHFSHGHHLRLGCDDVVVDHEKTRCNACIRPISSDPFFKCVQCEFFLHKACASLPRKKRNIMHEHKLTLEIGYLGGRFRCKYCLQFFDGFQYNCYNSCGSTSYKKVLLDVRCASISEPFHHELHPHPLYRTSTGSKSCGACGKESEYVLSCIACEFALSMDCATLPRKVKHRCDDHVLSLHHGAGNSTGQLWCDICEGKTDPSVWFYGCDECGVTLHIKCVLGDMYHLKPGNRYKRGELVYNDGMTRPYCEVCEKHCMYPVFLKGIDEIDSTILYACSLECAGEGWHPWVTWGDRYLKRNNEDVHWNNDNKT